MKTVLFLFIVLSAGFAAGIIHGAANLVLVEPLLDKAINIENQQLFASGEAEDTPAFWDEFNSFRNWQKGGQVLAGGILGLSIGALFGVVFAFSKNRLPGKKNVQKALVLAGLMWFVLFLIPAIKYPANPPTVGDPDTIIQRQSMYVLFIAASGIGTFGISQAYLKMNTNTAKKLAICSGIFAVYISGLFFLFPPNPDDVTAPMSLVNSFRIMSATTVTLYWIANGVILGILWEKFQPIRQVRREVNQ